MILDRATMAYSLESRSPFLDVRASPSSWRGCRRASRSAAAGCATWSGSWRERYLPREVLARKKQGFASPLMYILNEEVRRAGAAPAAGERAGARRVSADGAGAASWWSEHLERRRDHGNRIWLLLTRRGLVPALHRRAVGGRPGGGAGGSGGQEGEAWPNARAEMVPHHGHATPSVKRTAFTATVHCLTGCAIGEVLGMVIGTALRWSNSATVVLSIIARLLLRLRPHACARCCAPGLAFAAAAKLALAADTISIAIMELVDNAIMLVIPGAMEAGLGSRLFWGSLAAALIIAGVAAYPGELVADRPWPGACGGPRARTARLGEDGRESGVGEIRTHEGLSPLAVFKTAAFNHSATTPEPASY